MARPSNKAAAATQELGYALDWNVAFSGMSFLPELSGRQLLMTMQQMVETDETVGSMMYCITTTLSQVEWSMVAQVDGVDNNTDLKAAEAKAFADSLLIDMKNPFGSHVEDAVTMIWAASSACEIVLKKRDGVNSRFSDKFYGVDDLVLLPPLSIWSWIYDAAHRTVVGLNQVSYQGGAIIPMWKVALYQMTANADRPTGRSPLQNALRVWRLKNRIQDSEAIGIERELCGLPIFRVPEQDLLDANEKVSGAPTPKAMSAKARIAAALNAVQNIRLNKSGGLVLPSDTFSEDVEGDRTRKYDFSVLTGGGQRSIDARTAARDYDRAIARVVMMQFLHLGDRATGSFALSDDQSSMAVSSLMALSKKIAAQYTMKVLNLVWEVNGMDKKYMPRLGASELSKEGFAAIGAFLAGIAKADWLFASDTRARSALLSQAGFDYDPKAQAAAAEKVATAPVTPAPAPAHAPIGHNGPPPDQTSDPEESP